MVTTHNCGHILDWILTVSWKIVCELQKWLTCKYQITSSWPQCWTQGHPALPYLLGAEISDKWKMRLSERTSHAVIWFKVLTNRNIFWKYTTFMLGLWTNMLQRIERKYYTGQKKPGLSPQKWVLLKGIGEKKTESGENHILKSIDSCMCLHGTKWHQLSHDVNENTWTPKLTKVCQTLMHSINSCLLWWKNQQVNPAPRLGILKKLHSHLLIISTLRLK